MKSWGVIGIVAVAIVCLSFAISGTSINDDLKINQLQIIASHNSYHLRTEPAILRFLRFLYSLGALPGKLDPGGIDYSELPLTEQLEKYKLHGLELDIWNDPEGGRFYYRKGRALVWKRTASKIEALKQPGFKIMHIPDFDFRSTNYTFVDALAEIKRWSDAHTDHLPVFINVETETSAPGDIIHFHNHLVKAAKFDSSACDHLDAEVKSVFGENLDGVITPDKIRGNYNTLEEAVLAGNWPKLKDARGKVAFIIDYHDNVYDLYKAGHPSLRKRTMFVYAKPGDENAAFVILNGPVNDFNEIRACVRKGYMVRTRADGDTREARSGDYTHMNAAFASGAQIISTDYYRPDPRAGKRGWTDYHVIFPDGETARLDSIALPITR